MEREGVDEIEYEVDEVVDSRRLRNKLVYKVKWSSSEITEEPWYNLLPGSEVAVARFHQRMTTKPGPLASFKQQLSLLLVIRAGGDTPPRSYAIAVKSGVTMAKQSPAIKPGNLMTELTPRTSFYKGN